MRMPGKNNLINGAVRREGPCLLINCWKGVTDQSILVVGRQGRAVWGQEKRPWLQGSAAARHSDHSTRQSFSFSLGDIPL